MNIFSINTSRLSSILTTVAFSLFVLIGALRFVLIDARPRLTLHEVGSKEWSNSEQQRSTSDTTGNLSRGGDGSASLLLPPKHTFRNAREDIMQAISNSMDKQRHQQWQQNQQQSTQQRLQQRGYNSNFMFPAPTFATTTKYNPYNQFAANSTPAPIGAPGNARIQEDALRKALLSLQNPRLLGGDVLVGTGRRRNGRLIKFERSALVSPVSLWPNGVIFYELDESVAHLAELIWKVMQQFHDETCIRFIPRQNNEPDYLRIEARKGCFSYIGRIGGEQTLSLGDGCEYRGTISHELLHAVGFYHHQNRSDRDEHLEILWENIAKGKENQFLKMAPHENILLNEFDYDSIMLYGPHTFGKTLDRVTMKPKREGVILLEVVEKQGLSALDIGSVNKLYKCGTSY